MDLNDILEFINTEDDRLKERSTNSSENERVLARTVKLMEELGELCDEILASGGNQREEKLKNSSRENLQSEFADVVITTLLLAKTMKVDIEEALTDKIGKINDRYNN